MRIHTCLLDENNTRPVAGATFGDRLKRSGSSRLWEERNTPGFDTVVIHYISAVEHVPKRRFSLDAVLDLFIRYNVSSHYLIDRRGTVYSLIPEEKKAWHCGPSIMPPPDNRRGVNEFSVGIELMATHTSGFTQRQYRRLYSLFANIQSRSQTSLSVVGHEHIAGTRAVSMGLRCEPKTDPGPCFDWERFGRETGTIPTVL